MSNWSRKVRKRKQVELDDVAHAKAMAEIRKWEKGLVQHWLVTVRRLMMARIMERRAVISQKACQSHTVGKKLPILIKPPNDS